MEKEEVDRRSGRMTILKSGHGCTLPAWQLKTRQDGKRLLRSHLWCPNDLVRLWDRLETRSLMAGTSKCEELEVRTSSLQRLMQALCIREKTAIKKINFSR